MIESPDQIQTMDMLYIEVVDDSLMFGVRKIAREKALVWKGLWGPHGEKNYFWKQDQLFEFPYSTMKKAVERTARQLKQSGLEYSILNGNWDNNLVVFD